MVITDSGGIQEEASFFNKKTLVCRKTTERTESLGLTSFLVEDEKKLMKEFKKHINDYNINVTSPYGDGCSSNKIIQILKDKFYEKNS
jgi:UDP-N-acetylglucosamine 2-epimerase (non-hydrolysing)